MSPENVEVKPTTQEDVPVLVKLAPVLAFPIVLPIALPVALHAIHGLGVGAIGVMAANLVLGPRGKEFIQSSGEALCNLLSEAGKVPLVTKKEESK